MSNHICGIYYVLDSAAYNAKRYYLPQAELDSHTVISRLFYTTTLRQVFSNSSSSTIKELRYTFPLYDGVSVGAYTITYGDTTLTGVVKQKAEARQTYDAAVERGETASLLESLPAGIFGVTIGNLPAKIDVHVEITYAGELKHDAGVDGLRYMLPTSVAPRYGSYPGDLVTSNAAAAGISITVDVDMGKSNIRKMQSPSHPIAVSMGTLSTGDVSGEFKPSHASATLTQGTAELAGDFVLQVVVDDLDSPQAVLETHPELDSRAIMATLVPRFKLPNGTPEIIFIADQSGSMSGSKNTELIASLEVFLQSLPFGVYFNVCAFGSSYRYLWPKSRVYNETYLKQAQKFVKDFRASYGGTEMFEPVEKAFDIRHADRPLEIVLLTDGEIWGEDQLFDLINTKIKDEKVDARVFTLGIGGDVSHTLVEGVARAGNGFAQFITNNEEIDKKIMRSLKGALYPHLRDYRIEINFAESTAEEDEFEIIEKVDHQLSIDEPPAYDRMEADKPVASTSFFDTSADKDEPLPEKSAADRYAHLPKIQLPKILQAPSSIPPLYPFNRSTIYLMLGPEAPKQSVSSITLRATGPNGPLELRVPVYTQPEPSSTLHQLAARKAIQELEQGRGWLQDAITADGQSIKEKHSSTYDELVEREGVRLGTAFDVASRWTSFVAVSTDAVQPKAASHETSRQESEQQHVEVLRALSQPSTMAAMMAPGEAMDVQCCMATPAARHRRIAPFSAARKQSSLMSSPGKSLMGAIGGLFGSGRPSAPSPQTGAMSFSMPRSSSGVDRCAVAPAAPSQMLASRAAPVYADDDEDMDCCVEDDDEDMDCDDEAIDECLESPMAGEEVMMAASFKMQSPKANKQKQFTPAEDLRTIIKLQQFDGRWKWSTTLADAVWLRSGADKARLMPDETAGKIDDETATIYVLAFLEKWIKDHDVWELVADKARAYLAGSSELDVDAAIKQAIEEKIW